MYGSTFDLRDNRGSILCMMTDIRGVHVCWQLIPCMAVCSCQARLRLGNEGMVRVWRPDLSSEGVVRVWRPLLSSSSSTGCGSVYGGPPGRDLRVP